MEPNTFATCIALVSALGAFLFGLDIGYIAPILECTSFKRDVAHLADPENSAIPDVTVGFIVGIFSIGGIVSSSPPVTSYFLDTWGRRSSIMLGSAVFLIGCAVQTRASTIIHMLVGRFIAGLSIGLLSVVVALYQSEIAPPHLRGALTSLYQLMITFGILVAALIDYVWVGQDGGWRVAIMLQAIPGAGLLITMPFLPRSPRWLVQVGRRDEALEALYFIRDAETAEAELKDIVESYEKTEAMGAPRWSELFHGRVGRLVAVGVTLQMLQQLVGMNAFMYFGPRIFTAVKLDGNKFQAIINAVNLIATFPAIFLADTWGRRDLLVAGGAGMFIACVGMASIGVFFVPTDPATAHSPLVAYAIVSLIVLFVMSFAASWGPIVWVYNAEIFPLRARGRCVALTAMVNWIGNFFVAQFTPVLLGVLGFGSFYIFGCFCLLAFGLALWLPETKGVMLEHMDEVFDAKFGSSTRSEQDQDANKEAEARLVAARAAGTGGLPPASYGAVAAASSED